MDSLGWKDLSAGEITKRGTSKIQTGKCNTDYTIDHTGRQCPASAK